MKKYSENDKNAVKKLVMMRRVVKTFLASK